MKNKHNKQRLIGGSIIAVGIIFIIIGAIVFNSGSDNAENVMVAFGVISLPFFAVGGIWYAIATSNSRKVCDKCGESMNGCDYMYQEMSRKMTGNNLEVKVKIIAECPHCGEKKEFEKSFISKPGENLQFQVDEFCRNHFGY